ncbi:MAG TPA: HepT-like ribonuclease domain-containing protein [Burkholderiales bacterium]|nr:HepT-like ribonuclease domain-containing protein [Burkholderiales bacterium]
MLDEAPELRERFPDLELAVGLRNRLIHGYDRILLGVVFDTVRLDLPKLCAALEAELKRFPLP